MIQDPKNTLYGFKEIEEKDKSSSSDKKDYKVITVSLYNEDIELLDHYLSELKRLGYRRINKSKIIRYALRNIDISQIPKE